MMMDRNHLFLKVSLLTVLLGFSFLHGSWALATSEEQQERDKGDWVFINGEGVIDAPLLIVLEHLKDVQKSEPTIPGLKFKKVLEQISDSERIDYDHYELPWPFKDRYTIYRAMEKNIAGGETLITIHPLDSYPFKDEDKVAMKIKKSSFLLKSLSEDKTKTRVTVELTVDPGGFLPVWLLNFKSKSWPKELFVNLHKNIKRELARQNISEASLTTKTNTRSASDF